jgi:pimeloyl-ACP methyl ester carboxylesterase
MKPSTDSKRPMSLLILTLIAALGWAAPGSAEQPWVSERGTLPRGTSYEMRKPNNWNGTLISDLDFAAQPDGPTYLWLLNHGYALSGTQRRDDRATKYDSAHEIVDLINIMDLFEARFGKPQRTVEMGQSGGGNVALLLAEQHPDRIDGAVALCAHTPFWFISSALDTWFVLKVLIAPDLQIVDVPADKTHLAAAWRKALAGAQETPVGRARIALAITIGQEPAWSSKTTPEPDPQDVAALQLSMFESLLADEPGAMTGAAHPGGSQRYMLERSGGGQLSSNVGVDYTAFFANGDKAYQAATRKLYAAAGADLKADLARVNAADRIKPDRKAVKWWSAPGRAVSGELKVPVMRVHTHADPITPASQVQGYDAAVAAHGRETFYRTAFVRAAGHCNFTVAERVAAVAAVMRRLDTGAWGSTIPEAMNALGASLDPETGTHFFPYEQFKYNRAWFPSLSDYTGREGP